MIRRAFLLLIGGFIFQSLLSCYDSCNYDLEEEEMVYTSMDLNVGTIIENHLNPIQDSVPKDSFNLIVSFVEIEKRLANSYRILRLGFNSLLAEDCIQDYIYLNTVQNLNISMINQKDSSQSKDVTENFIVKAQNGTYSIQEIIEFQSAPDAGGNHFSLSLDVYDSIYQKASFKVIATLESGETFTEETEEIIFTE
jgi:hypothetical protein